MSAGASYGDKNKSKRNGAFGKRPYRRWCSLRRKQAALAGGGAANAGTFGTQRAPATNAAVQATAGYKVR